MQRLRLENGGVDFPTPTSVFEHELYTPEAPYSVEYQKYEVDSVTRPHYAHTLEVIVSFGVEGLYRIGTQEVRMERNSIFLIPPKVLHSGRIRGSKDGYLINMKFDFEQLRPMINMEKLLALAGCSLSSFCSCRPNYQATVEAIRALIAGDEEPLERYAAVLRFFNVCAHGMQENEPVDLTVGETLSELIDWTEANYKTPIRIEDAASVMHLSRSYFCKLFKLKTGMTFIAYLNRLRIEQAQLMLLSGMSASACCVECGFENLSYFIQLFKRTTGLTTREYVEKVSSMRKA